jgi:hypothetical protein
MRTVRTVRKRWSPGNMDEKKGMVWATGVSRITRIAKRDA